MALRHVPSRLCQLELIALQIAINLDFHSQESLEV